MHSLYAQVPDSVTKSVALFAKHLEAKYKQPNQKIEVVYNWVSSRIKYDSDSALYFNWNMGFDQRNEATLRRRKGVCENYASLMSGILQTSGVKAYVVHGYATFSTSRYNASHAWVAAEAEEGKWYLYDPTWDNQSTQQRYYKKTGEEFILTHIPFDPLWQLQAFPLAQNFSKQSNMQGWNYADSIKVYLSLNEEEQLQAANRRMEAAGIQAENIRLWYLYNAMKLSAIQEEKQLDAYRKAVSSLNAGIGLINEVINWRNNPASYTAASFQQMNIKMQACEQMLWQVRALMSRLDGKNHPLLFDLDELDAKYDRTLKRMEEQKSFLKSYFSKLSKLN